MPEVVKQSRRVATEKRILVAAEEIIVRQGFDRLGINMLAAEASVSKHLIYRYFGNLDGVIVALMQKREFWSTDTPLSLLGAVDKANRDKQILHFLKSYARILRKDERLREIRRWELVSTSAVIHEIGKRRERTARMIVEALGDGPEADTAAHLALIQAGITYLVLRGSSLPTFYGVPLTTEKGWARLESALESIVERIFSEDP